MSEGNPIGVISSTPESPTIGVSKLFCEKNYRILSISPIFDLVTANDRYEDSPEVFLSRSNFWSLRNDLVKNGVTFKLTIILSQGITL